MVTKKSGWQRIRSTWHSYLSYIDSTEDSDRLFSYYTRQQVMFLDWRLGCTFAMIQLSFIIFFVGYTLIYKEGYMRFEQAKGLTVTHVSGDAVAISSGKSASRFFSPEELTYPGMFNGEVFVATRQIIARQERGTCEDKTVPCLTDEDCTQGGQGECSENGFCIERSWCDIHVEPEIYSMRTDTMQIWTRSSIQYLKLAPEKVFTTDSKDGGVVPQYIFTVRELLSMCKPLPINYEEVAELGAVMEVGFRWNCNVKFDLSKEVACSPTITVRRLDTIMDPDNIGFGFEYADYIDDERREHKITRGLKFIFTTTGSGKRISVSAFVITASTSGTLLSFAVVIADLLLTKVFRNRRKYCARKFETTPDFSKFMEEQEEKILKRSTLKDKDDEENATLRKEREWLVKFEEEA